MKLYVYTFVSEDKDKEIVENEVFLNFFEATNRLMESYKTCLINMQITEDEDSGYTHNIDINSQHCRACVSDDITGETCVWTINIVDVVL